MIVLPPDARRPYIEPPPIPKPPITVAPESRGSYPTVPAK